jgi:hypothetical protein
MKASDVTATSATIRATIQPNGAPTTYEMWLEWRAECSRHGCEKVDFRRLAHGTISASKAAKSLSVRARLKIPKWEYAAFVTATNEHGEVEEAVGFTSR